MSLTTLIELHRGGTLECQHFGAIAVAGTRGELVAHAGDPQWLTFSRSTLKPLQALPFMEAGGPQRFGYTQAQLAMLCASHSGEPMHVAQVQAMLDQAGVGYRALQCGCHVPLFTEMGIAAPADAVFDERHHNCSGKHSGFLAHCVQQDWALDTYLEPAHPLQQAIRRDVARATRMNVAELRVGIDGCSAPNYALPLVNLATGYARLASGAGDSEFGGSFALLRQAMTAHPDLVSGTGRNDLAFMRAGRGDWVSKAGADGVQVIGSHSRGQALALKIIDANKPAVYAATVEALDQLGWLDDTQRAELAPWRADTLYSVRGRAVGTRQPAFQLVFGG